MTALNGYPGFMIVWCSSAFPGVMILALLQARSNVCTHQSCVNWDEWIHAATFPSSTNNKESLLFHGR